MDVDMVKVPKLTPEKQEKCAKKGLYFCCHKSGHMASAYPAFLDQLKKPVSNALTKRRSSLSLEKLKIMMKMKE